MAILKFLERPPPMNRIEILTGDSLQHFKENVNNKRGLSINKYKGEILIEDLIKLCSSGSVSGFSELPAKVQKSDYIVLLYAGVFGIKDWFENECKASVSGFAIVEKNDNEQCLYVSMCKPFAGNWFNTSRPWKKYKGKCSEDPQLIEGDEMMQEIINIAKKENMSYIKIPSLFSAITFYRDHYKLDEHIHDPKTRKDIEFNIVLLQDAIKEEKKNIKKTETYDGVEFSLYDSEKDTILSKDEYNKIDKNEDLRTNQLYGFILKIPESKSGGKITNKRTKKTRTRKLIKQRRKNKKSKKYLKKKSAFKSRL